MTNLVQNGGSFRDPAGFVFHEGRTVYRQVNVAGATDYDILMSSGLHEVLVEKGMLVGHKVAKNIAPPAPDICHVVIKPEIVPFISYPYEWTFDQLKAAALLTLEVMKIALEHDMILKDASAYNVQFIGSRAVFIDTLSFAAHTEGEPWDGYKQFCEHFIAPLAVAHYTSGSIIKIMRSYIDGLPLNVACQLLPAKARLRGGLLAHLYIHGSSQRRHQKGGAEIASKAKQRKMSHTAMLGLISSLERTVKSLRYPQNDTEWGDYYTFTNYSDKAFQAKRKLVSDLIKQLPVAPKLVWDVGANNGEFSEVAIENGAYTIAFDIDEVAVTRNYRAKRPSEMQSAMLPLVQDLTNPSPGTGWAHEERQSLIDRGPADLVMALAIIHHLSIGNNLPFEQVASFMHSIGKHVIIEFVPKGDSKVDHLLASRKDIFGSYDVEHFEAAFGKHFKLLAKKPVKDSKRTMYLYKAR